MRHYNVLEEGGDRIYWHEDTLFGKQLRGLYVGKHGSDLAVECFKHEIQPHVVAAPEDWVFAVEGTHLPAYQEQQHFLTLAKTLGIPCEEPVPDSIYHPRLLEEAGVSQEEAHLLMFVNSCGQNKDPVQTLMFSGMGRLEAELLCEQYADQDELVFAADQVSAQLDPVVNSYIRKRVADITREFQRPKLFVHTGEAHLPTFTADFTSLSVDEQTYRAIFTDPGPDLFEQAVSMAEREVQSLVQHGYNTEFSQAVSEVCHPLAYDVETPFAYKVQQGVDFVDIAFGLLLAGITGAAKGYLEQAAQNDSSREITLLVQEFDTLADAVKELQPIWSKIRVEEYGLPPLALQEE